MSGQDSDLAWKRTLLAGACLAMAFGAFACTGYVTREPKPGATNSGTGASGPNGTGATAPDPTGTGSTSVTGGGPGGSGGAAATGGPPQLTPLTLDGGRTVIRRLNRTEYNLTVRDLLGTSTTPGDALPPDPPTDLFDTVGEFLSVSELQVETLETAAGALADELFALPTADAKRTKVFVCTLATGAEATCARKILTTFARRAFRRPAATAEIDSLMALVDKVRAGGTYNDGLKAAITAVLLSPHFLYRAETSVGVGATGAKPLNPFELATRLSYFGWSKMPDGALASSASTGNVTPDPANVPAQPNPTLAAPSDAARPRTLLAPGR